MIFNLPFLLAYILSTIICLKLLYFSQYRWVALLISSIVFYGLIVQSFIWILFVFSLIVYVGAELLSRKNNFSKSKYRLILFLALLPLVAYKFLPLFFKNISSSFDQLASFQLNNFHYVVGLSFFTFNGISYLVDIKRGYIQPERNFGLLLLYLSYFPHLLSGPLHRAKYLIPQFKTSICLTDQNFSNGFRLVLWGIFKKYVLAQNLKVLVDSIIDHPDNFHGAYVLLAGFVFFLQIYCDFSSYIDIGQGISQLFGIRLQTNFDDRVYASSSRKQFWNGWNISINNWFKDYFFYPLTKFAVAQWQINSAVVLTFILVGLWHGITFSFILWGFLNGIWILSERYLKPSFGLINDNFKSSLGLLYHLLFASLIALVFRSNSLSLTFSSLFDFDSSNAEVIPISKGVIFGFLFMDFIYRKSNNKRIDDFIGGQKTYVRWLFYFVVIVFILMWGLNMRKNAFYYFQF